MNALGVFDFVLDGGDAESKMAHAERLGFTAVEAMGPLVRKNPVAYVTACTRHGVTISCVTGVWLGAGISTDEVRRAEQITVHQTYLKLAAETGCNRYIFVDHLPEHPTPEPAVCRELMVDTLAQLADTAESEGVTILIEAIVRKYRPVLATVREAAEFVREFGRPSVKMMVDSYHMAANGEDLAGDTEAVWDVCGHVHVSDYQAPPAEPERPYPGDGVVDFGTYLKPIVAAGYDGPIILEGAAVGGKDVCLKRSRAHVEAVLDQLRAEG